ncbi:Rid family hydrolase [Phenylobacterium sp.]|uniref:Rid family hydrolase n=1 Tax=Phenylobacterium sp. TaxID=1871053 RepID=UPI0027352E6D|nr:Rid family hydrolase [Phenylobacterium sp.]MDP3853032.1 Rid family hydrolase [Phenylobacterium sp.]
MSVMKIGSGEPFEEVYGYSRAVRVENHVFVAGTTARAADLEGNAYVQARSALAIVASALSEIGAQMGDVVRTVTYVVDLADLDHVARAHAKVFGAALPAATLVQVSGLVPSTARVEIEVTAVISSQTGVDPAKSAP